jgi:hypothetical protein
LGYVDRGKTQAEIEVILPDGAPSDSIASVKTVRANRPEKVVNIPPPQLMKLPKAPAENTIPTETASTPETESQDSQPPAPTSSINVANASNASFSLGRYLAACRDLEWRGE